MQKIIIAAMCSVLLSPSLLPAWSGYDWESGNDVEIERGNTVRRGNIIEFYDYHDGSYRDAEVTGIYRNGNRTEVEVYDYEKDEYRTFEMER